MTWHHSVGGGRVGVGGMNTGKKPVKRTVKWDIWCDTLRFGETILAIIVGGGSVGGVGEGDLARMLS